MTDDRPLGPNAKKLLSQFIARESIPPGGGLADAMMFFANAEYRRQALTKAMTNMETAIEAIKSAPDNPYGDDDETIAAAILQRIEQGDGQHVTDEII